MSSMTKPVILWSATPTPFLSNGDLDESSLGRLVDQHLSLGVRGLFLGGTVYAQSATRGTGPRRPEPCRRSPETGGPGGWSQ